MSHLETTKKSKRKHRYKSITLKTFGDTFLPLKNSFEFLEILGIYSIKRITKNQKEF